MNKSYIFILVLIFNSCQNNNNSSFDEDDYLYEYKVLFSNFEKDVRNKIEYENLTDKHFLYPQSFDINGIDKINKNFHRIIYNEFSLNKFKLLLSKNKKEDLIYIWNKELLDTPHNVVYDTVNCDCNLVVEEESKPNKEQIHIYVCFKDNKILSIAPQWNFEENKLYWW